MVVGGSLGAKSINEAIDHNLKVFAQDNLQLIWQTGIPYFEKAKEAVKGIQGTYVKDFITQMDNAYAAADVIISRSGAMAVAELCLVQKPVIFVPFPFAAEDHQTANASALVAKDAAISIKDSNVTSGLVPALINLLQDTTKQINMKNNIAALGVKNADEIIAAEILKNIKST